MSKKDVEKYYETICKQYTELLEELRELEEEHNSDLISMDIKKNLEMLVEPAKNNYLRWSYMMYLLNEPQKKDKKKRYREQQKKKIEQVGNLKKIEEEEYNQSIKNIKESM